MAIIGIKPLDVRYKPEWRPAYKWVQIAMPETAHAMGYPVEAPVLWSPIVTKEQYCWRCGGTYKPIVYPQDGLVKSFHADKGCEGIFHFHLAGFDAGWVQNATDRYDGGRALLRGATDCRRKIEGRYWHSACSGGTQMKVKLVGVFCVGCKQTIDEGLVVPIKDYRGDMTNTEAYCESCFEQGPKALRERQGEPRYFVHREGQLLWAAPKPEWMR